MFTIATWEDIELLRENPRSLSRARHRGEVVRIRPGYYLDTEIWAEAPPWQRMALIISARAAAFPKTIFCGASAVFLHDLPLLNLPATIELAAAPHAFSHTYPPLTDRVEGARGRQRWGFVTRPGEIMTETAHGLRVQEIGEAVGEYLRAADFRSGVVVLDAYRHRLKEQETPLGHIPAEWLSTGIAAERHRVEAAWAASTDLSESPAETLTRINAIMLGFAPPQLQVWVVAPNGKRYRLDLVWPGRRIVGEVDGKRKLGTTPEEKAKALAEERERQEALQQMGYHVVRITMKDAEDPARLRERGAQADLPRQ
jgi:hypothetical protein